MPEFDFEKRPWAENYYSIVPRFSRTLSNLLRYLKVSTFKLNLKVDSGSSSPLLASVALFGLDWLPLAMISKSWVMPGANGPWGSHSNSEVKQHWAKTLHRWETVRELMEQLARVQITMVLSDHWKVSNPPQLEVCCAQVERLEARQFGTKT